MKKKCFISLVFLTIIILFSCSISKSDYEGIWILIDDEYDFKVTFTFNESDFSWKNSKITSNEILSYLKGTIDKINSNTLKLTITQEYNLDTYSWQDTTKYGSNDISYEVNGDELTLYFLEDEDPIILTKEK